jgi:hypothetical protein
MLLFAVALFLIAATFGLAILTTILQDKPTKKIVLYLHGSLAAFAILLIAGYLVMFGGDLLLIISLILFLFAALGGLTLFTLDLKKKPIPKWLAVIHPLVAIMGLITLVVYILP